MKTCDILIIGGGVTGCAIARELSRYRLRSVLIEKEAELSFGVSKSNSGIVHPGTQHAPGLLKSRLCVEGNILTRRLARELDIDVKEVGELIVAFTPDEVRRLAAIKRDGDALGVPRLRIVDRAWLRRHEPKLSCTALGALYAPTAGIISPYRWVYDLAENAQTNGVEIHTDTVAQKIELLHPGFAVTTPRTTYRARIVINAAGLWADAVAGMVGVTDFKITPRKGEEFLLDKKDENITRHLIFPLPTATSKGILIIRTSDGNPMIGPTALDGACKDDLTTTAEGLAQVIAGAKKLVPSINENHIIAYFAGLRPVAGEDFIIRREPNVPGMITVAGIQSPGLTAAPAIARMVVGLVRACGCTLRTKILFHRRRRPETHLFAVPLARTKRLIRHSAGYGDIVCRCEMVSAEEVRDAIRRGARTMDGIKFRTRAQAGRCHGSFCTTRIMKILAAETKTPLTKITKRGGASVIVKKDKCV